MGPARPILLALVAAALFLVPAVSTAHVTLTGGAKEDLSGLNAVANLATFTLAHPNRNGETPTMQLARDHLESELESMGYSVERHKYGGGQNIVGILRGTVRPHDWVVVSAHYDSVQLPSIGSTVHGAWDNGAGVAAALEIARVAAQRSWNNTLAIEFFDDEELGLVGSGAWVPAYDGRAWEDGRIRLVANLNMDPPGLNWPCAFEGAVLPVTMFQNGDRAPGTGHMLLREYALASKVDEGVPEQYFEFLVGGVNVGILSGTSDNARFWARGVPEIWIGGSTHLFLGQERPTRVSYFMYPLHTPADTISTMAGYCPNGLDKGFGVAMRLVYGSMERIDAYPGAFPRP